ncbi:MAG: lipopolysaccharide assembly LapA domain-containing protein [Labedaea sp.]
MIRRHSVHPASSAEQPAEPTAESIPASTGEARPAGGDHSAGPAGDAYPTPVEPAHSPAVPRTRTGAAWAGLTVAALIAIMLIVFLVQNTGTVEISFLWMTGSTSLAVALLIAAVGSVLVTLILGTARIAQLRRLARRRRT